jgi:O-antigen ligase
MAKVEMLTVLTDQRNLLYTIMLLIPVFGMHTPVAGESLSLFAAIVVLAIEWKRIEIDAELKRTVVLFIIYLTAFTVLSADHGRSLKGSYDILRGLLHFPIALLLAQYAKDRGAAILLNTCVTGLLVAQFLFPQTGFFGFYVNPNNVAVMLVFLLSLSLPPLRSSGKIGVAGAIAALGLVLGIFLLVLTNSRAAWLGCAVAAGTLVISMKTLSARLKVLLLALVAGALIGALIFLNLKGLELNLRDVIWKALFTETLSNSPWFGYGINYAKELMPAIEVPFQTTHNLFLEFFVSSGFVGLAFMLYLFYRLLKHYLSFAFDKRVLFYSGVLGLIAFFVIDQFDLKFASYRFFGTHCFFLGLIYAHRREAGEIATGDRMDGRA